MKWFRVGGYGGYGDELIKPVEVDKETKHFVFIGKNRHTKDGRWMKHFPTWEEAKAHLDKKAENNLTTARHSLEAAQGFAGNVKGLKPPGDA